MAHEPASEHVPLPVRPVTPLAFAGGAPGRATDGRSVPEGLWNRVNPMKIRVAVLATILTVSLTAASDDPLAGRAHEPPLRRHLDYTVYSSKVDGVDRLTVVTDELFSDAPSWSPETGTVPPLSIPGAIAAAREVLTTTVRDVANWQLTQVSLQRCVEENWAYIVRWTSLGEGPDYLSVPVLLSGRAVSPVPADNEKK